MSISRAKGLTLNAETVGYSKALVNIHRTTQRHVSEDLSVTVPHSENPPVLESKVEMQCYTQCIMTTVVITSITVYPIHITYLLTYSMEESPS